MTAEKVLNDVWAYWTRAGELDSRAYLGASIIGDPCVRRLWLRYRGMFRETFSPRVLRLFERGRREELIILMELAGAGYNVLGADPETGEQFGYGAYDGHFRCHIDGKIELGGEWTLLECKTHNDRAFYKLDRDGVAVANPKYYVQMQVCMAMAKLKQGLYYGVNKNTDAIYPEIIPFDAKVAQEASKKVARVLFPAIPERIDDAKECSKCPAKEVCANPPACTRVPVYNSTKAFPIVKAIVPEWKENGACSTTVT